MCLFMLTACYPGTPGDERWQTLGARAFGEVASSLTTVELVLSNVERDNFLGGYATVTVGAAEDTAGGTAQSFLALQPPKAEQARAATISQLFGDATDLLQEVRIKLMNQEAGLCEQYCSKLDGLANQLSDVETALASSSALA